MTGPEPLVWVVMPTTRARAEYLTRALANWQRQTYGNFRVLVLDTCDQRSPSIVRDHIPDDPRFLYGCVPPMPLGEKYNAGCHMAPDGALLAFSGDDDWNHPDRLRNTVAAMEAARVDVAGSMSMLCFRERDRQAFSYRHPYVVEMIDETDDGGIVTEHTMPYMVHGTMVVAKAHWERCQMPSLQRASDSVWTREMLALSAPVGEPIDMSTELSTAWTRVVVGYGGRELAFLQMDAPTSYVAWAHDGCTGNPLARTGGVFFKPWEGGIGGLTTLLGPDAPAFGLADSPAAPQAGEEKPCTS